MLLTSSLFVQSLIVGFLSIVLGSQWLIFWVVKVLYYIYIILFDFGRLYFRTSFSDNQFSLYTIFIIIKIGSRIFAGSWVVFFLTTVNGFQPFALVMKSSILDLAGLLGPPLFNIMILLVILQLPVIVQITLLI